MDRIDRRVEFNNLLESSDSSESEAEGVIVRVVKPRNNLLDELDSVNFKKRFRMSKQTFRHLVDLLEGIAEPADNRNQPISKVNQVLIALRFYATGSFQINVGDHFNVSQSSVCRITKNISRHIAALRPEFIKMPQTNAEKREVVLNFFQLAGLPGVIGALDCTHIKIQSPGGNNAEVFRNRKGYFSINTQVIGDAKLKIMDIVARWPESVHDTTIFNDSNIRARFENSEFSPYLLVGDGGYPCRTYLITPLLQPHRQPEERYNTAQISTRNPIERLFGVWKRRFPCLSLGMRLNVEGICEVIVATAVLHNMCLRENDDIEPFLDGDEDVFENNAAEVVQYAHNENHNTSVRDAIISNVFTAAPY